MVTFAEKDDKFVCSFSGQMNTENCYKTQELVLGEVRKCRKPVIFDMKKVTYVSSVFLSMCIQVLREAGAENFMILNVDPSVKKVFKVAGLDMRITMA
ncbi:MAG: STAS domain-containing protein [Candidatus Omnitrophota bacterium]